MMKLKKLKIKKLKSIRKLAKELWDLQSSQIRQEENGVCFTCGDQRNWKEQQAGHFEHGDAVDFVPGNIHCQCVRCNHWLSGNGIEYTLKMVDLYGRERVEEIKLLKNKIRKYPRWWLEDSIQKYKEARNVDIDNGSEVKIGVGAGVDFTRKAEIGKKLRAEIWDALVKGEEIGLNAISSQR